MTTGAERISQEVRARIAGFADGSIQGYADGYADGFGRVWTGNGAGSLAAAGTATEMNVDAEDLSGEREIPPEMKETYRNALQEAAEAAHRLGCRDGEEHARRMNTG